MMRTDKQQVIAIDDVSRQRIIVNGVQGEWLRVQDGVPSENVRLRL